MKQNRWIAFLLCMITVFLLRPAAAAAEAPSVVYTQFVSGNFNHSGDGTEESPYNLFEDALAAVADGGTIYISGAGAFINSKSDIYPFRIDKNVTISALPGAAVRPELSVRTMGMALGADVTFRNIVLSLAEGYRPIICANGYTLTMEDISYSSGTRVVHLAGGGMYAPNGICLSPEAGPHSRIIVKGSKSVLGNIYAGGINHGFDKNIDITVEEVAGSNIGTIYASGASEGYYNGDNFMDPDNEPEPPDANPIVYPVSGKVSVELRNTGVRAVNGETGGTQGTYVSVSTKYRYSCRLEHVDSFCVKQGVFEPENIMQNGVNLSVESGGTLDLSRYADYQAGDFAGGGMLVLSREGCLTIQGTCTGETELQTEGGSAQYSGLAQYNHLYIRTRGDAVFTFRPYPTQKDMTLDKCADGWRTSVQTEAGATELTKFEINGGAVFVTAADINGAALPEIAVNAEFTDDSRFEDIGMLPLEYSVTYRGEKFSVKPDFLESYEYYEGNIPELNMNIAPIGDVIIISNFSETYGFFEEIAPGVYDIEVTAPVGSGYVTCLIHLVVVDDSLGENVDIFEIYEQNGKIDVQFTNETDADINDAVLLLALYNGGTFRKAIAARESVDVWQGAVQRFSFDVGGEAYSAVKLFIWNSFQGMTPVMRAYSSGEENN